VSEELITER